MSYILDALRRAQAERGQGAAPNLYTQSLPWPAAERSAWARWWPPFTAAALATALLLALGVAAGRWWASERQTAALPPAPAAPAAPSHSLAAAALPASDAIPEKKRGPSPPRAKPAPARAALAASDRAPARASPPAAAAPASTSAPTTTPGGTVFALSELPESLRAQLPTLRISGLTHSSNPRYRMAIVNGQVLHEGDPAAPGLRLETIEADRTIWSFHGYRYGLVH